MPNIASRDPAAIRAGIERARRQIEQSVAELRLGVAEKLRWRSMVRRHPTAVLLGAFTVGLLVARQAAR